MVKKNSVQDKPSDKDESENEDFDDISKRIENLKKGIALESDNPIWDMVSPFIQYAKWAWILLMIYALIRLVMSVLGLIGFALFVQGSIGINILSILISICLAVFSLFWVKPYYSDKILIKDYSGLLDDAFNLGKIRIPKMLLIGLILELLTDWWGGALIFVPAFLIVYHGPFIPYNWNSMKKK